MSFDLHKICRKVEAEICHQHKKHAKANVVGKSIKISACCDNFQMILEGLIEREMETDIDRSVDDELDTINMN
jgi:hypothetical protein